MHQVYSRCNLGSQRALHFDALEAPRTHSLRLADVIVQYTTK